MPSSPSDQLMERWVADEVFENSFQRRMLLRMCQGITGFEDRCPLLRAAIRDSCFHVHSDLAMERRLASRLLRTRSV